jgi:NAD(P)-dependent dehydrogenase (short-subunit alcohol dehydrogenase family)
LSDLQRPEPPITARTGEYWRSGADGRLRLATCLGCGWRLHPPRPVCPKCRGREISFEPVSGRARLGLPTPGELAALAVFLCSPAAAHLTGQVISVNGGLHAA